MVEAIVTAKLRLALMLADPENNFKGFDKTLSQRYLSELQRINIQRHGKLP